MPVSAAGRARPFAPDYVKLPGARVLASPSALAGWLEEHGIPVRSGNSVRLESLKLRPGRRLTVRLRVGRATYYAKLYHPERARSVEEKYRKLTRLLARIRALRLPELRATDRERGILVWDSFPGAALLPPESSSLAIQGRLRSIRRVGRVLARVHGTRLSHHLVWTPAHELEVLDQRLADAPAGARVLARALAARLPRASRAHTVHRDFYAEQVLIGRKLKGRSAAIAFLDWDDATLGPPGLDVGNALAHFELAGLRSPRVSKALARIRRAFVSGYRAGASATDQASWPAWEAASLLRLAGLAWSRHRGRDPVRRGPGGALAASTIPAREEAELLAGLAAQRLGRRGRG